MNVVANIHPLLTTSVRVLWKVLLFPIAATLLLLEPVVGFACGVMMFGGIFAAVAFEVSAVGPRFPFLFMLGLSLSFGIFFLLYQFLIVFLVRD
jgi:hypothetical protein